MSLSFWMGKLERVQYHAALAVTGTWKGTNREKIYDELGLEPLWKRRWFRFLVQFYKIQNDLTPNYLKIPVPPTRSHLYGLRSDNVLNFIKCRTNPYSNTFCPHSVKIWNEIGPAFRFLNQKLLKWYAFQRRAFLISTTPNVLKDFINYVLA